MSCLNAPSYLCIGKYTATRQYSVKKTISTLYSFETGEWPGRRELFTFTSIQQRSSITSSKFKKKSCTSKTLQLDHRANPKVTGLFSNNDWKSQQPLLCVMALFEGQRVENDVLKVTPSTEASTFYPIILNWMTGTDKKAFTLRAVDKLPQRATWWSHSPKVFFKIFWNVYIQ